jgi:hypothetical protein
MFRINYFLWVFARGRQSLQEKFRRGQGEISRIHSNLVNLIRYGVAPLA